MEAPQYAGESCDQQQMKTLSYSGVDSMIPTTYNCAQQPEYLNTEQNNSQKPLEEYLSANEILAVNQMRLQMQQEGICVPDENLVQALMARKFEVDRAVSLVKNQIAWKNEHVNDLLLNEGILQEMRTGKVIAPPNARDNTGAQIIYFSPRLHDPKASSSYDVFRMTYYMIDRLLEDIQTQRNGFLIVVDMHGAGWRNFDRKLPKVFVNNMQNRFPGRLHLVLMLHPPTIFKVMYELVRPFIPEKYLGKIKVVKGGANLLQYIDASNLLQEYGGTMSFNQNAYIDTLVEQQQRQQFQQQQPQQQEQFSQQQPQLLQQSLQQQQQFPQQQQQQFLQQQFQQPMTTTGTGDL